MPDTDPRVDRSRGAVYHAEDTLASVMRRPHRAVRIARQVLLLPPERHFTSLEEIQQFVDRVLADPRTLGRHPGLGSVRVVSRRGFRRATYAQGVISIPAADPRGRWALTGSVVLHEVAHHLAGEPGHGTLFRAALLHLHAEHTAPEAATLLRHLFAPLEALPPVDGPQESDQVRRVAALLAKAESTTSAEESEAYLAKAAELAQRHSVDMAVAAMAPRAHSAGPTHRMLSIGQPRAALNTLLVSLIVQIAHAWGVRVDIGPGSTYVLLYGLPSDLDRVESIVTTAGTMMVARAGEHVRSGRWKGTTYLPPDSSAPRAVTAQVARNAFCLGFVSRLGQRLAQGAAQARASAAGLNREGSAGRDAHGSGFGATTVDLALRARDVAVADYHRTASSARGRWRGTASAAGSATRSRRAGEAAAEEYGRRGIDGQRRALGR